MGLTKGAISKYGRRKRVGGKAVYGQPSPEYIYALVRALELSDDEAKLLISARFFDIQEEFGERYAAAKEGYMAGSEAKNER